MMFFQKRYLFFQTCILRFQKYECYGVDKTEVYWIHFTRSDVKNILRKYGFSDKQRVFPVGTLLEYEMNAAAACFHENYNRDINIEEYAASRDMSVSWFIRNFKKYTGSTPMQFIVSLHISNAQILLETTNYAVNEISRIVGYDNPLYFSRLFHKLKGYSPTKHRKRKTEIQI